MKLIKSILATATVMAAVTATAAVPENVYMIGSATSAGWTTGSAVEMTKEGNTFTFEGVLNGGNSELKFLTEKNFECYSFYAMEANSPITTAGIENYTVSYHQGDPDNKWVVETKGIYKVTLVVADDPTSDDGGTLTVSYVGEAPDEIYMLGAAVDAWGDSTNGKAIYGKEGIYTWTGDLLYYGEDKLIKFALTKGSWNQVTYLVPTETNLNGNVLQIETGTYGYQESREDNGGLKDWFWGIKQGLRANTRFPLTPMTRLSPLNCLKAMVLTKTT